TCALPFAVQAAGSHFAAAAVESSYFLSCTVYLPALPPTESRYSCMALKVDWDVSADAPWNGRSTPTTRVLLPPPPPVLPPPDLLQAAPPRMVMAATASAVMRLVMLVLSVIMIASRQRSSRSLEPIP